MRSNLNQLFTSIVLAAELTACATVQLTDMNSCKTWTESSTSKNIPLLYLSSTSEQKFSSSCDEGRTAANTTLAGNDGKHLHFASAFIGQEFVKEKIKAIQSNQNVEYNKATLRTFEYFLGVKGFKISDIEKSLTPTSHQKTKPDPACNGTGVAKLCKELQ